MNIIGPSTHVLDLGVSMSSNCFVRLTFIFLICINNAQYPVLSAVPQGTVLGPLPFIIMITNINKDILSSKVISFADDTRVYTNITQIENPDSLQTDLNYIYLWAINNNILFKSLTTFHLAHHCLLIPMYTILDIINPSENVLDLGITMSRNCSFDIHITGWILRTFTSRDVPLWWPYSKH